MSSLVSQAIKTSKSRTKATAPSPGASAPKSLQALAMERAKKAAAKKAPASGKRGAARERTPSRPPPPQRSRAESSDSETPIPARAVLDSPVQSPSVTSVESSPSPVIQSRQLERLQIEGGAREEFVARSVSPRAERYKQRAETDEWQDSSRIAQAAAPEPNPVKRTTKAPKSKDSEPKASRTGKSGSSAKSRTPSQPVNNSSGLRGVILRLVFGVLFGLVIYLGRKTLEPRLELPAAVSGDGDATMQLYLKSTEGEDYASAQRFQSSLKETLQDRYSETVPVTELYKTYEAMREVNLRLFAVIGMLVGFLVASLFM